MKNKHLGLHWEFIGTPVETVVEHTTNFTMQIDDDRNVKLNGRKYNVKGIGEFTTAISHLATRQGILFSEDQICLLARTLTELANDTQLTLNDSYQGICH